MYHHLQLFPLLLLSLYIHLSLGQDVLVFQTTTANPLQESRQVTTTIRPIANWVLVNNRRIPGTIAPFVTLPPPTQQFLDCFGSCPTTPEYNPICGSNMQLYLNEQKFNCARFCGADIQIVRRGSCEGLFPMMRG
ncbi:uncharacterized protein Dwil_GK27098 [Drosophila willistoni]|uniref:Kazal-like domain-containing protein n=2 Tax=Drosophila willistoni TaxID=7260 RepID=A0A0Q9X2H5_DROWI|nr:uncharacterized protein Dwil_GK27098 [Drosophila willistoni]